MKWIGERVRSHRHFFPISRSDPNLGPVSWVGSFPVDEGGRCRRWIADGRIVEDSVMIDVTGIYAIVSA